MNWLHKFSISEGEEDVVSCIKNALEEFAPGHASYVEHEKEIAKIYKQGLVPINMLLKQYNGDLLRLFSFASEHKLNLALGNYEKLIDDCKKIGQNLVVDALTLVIIAYHGCLPVLDGFSHVYVNWRSVATIQQLFLGYGFNCLSDILTWFQISSNIIFESDGFIDDDSNITEMFSPDFAACCRIASTYKIPYLYCDLVAWNFQQIPELGIASDVKFVSIPTVCYKSFALNQEKLNDALYSFLKDSTFINFNAGTILQQIRKQNYDVTTELISPFMFCTPSCDMHSFASVYLSAIAVLRDEQYKAAIALAGIVINDALKIWRKGTYHRQLAERIPNAESEYKADAISNYVLEILQGIKEIFNQIPDEISVSLMTLTEKSGYSLD